MSYNEAIEFDNLYWGLKECCRGVRWKDSVLNYEHNALKNTYLLRQSLLNNTYVISDYRRFIIYEPKKREIVATRLKDRQVQRSICNCGFYHELTRSFIFENCACLKNRGVDYALKQMKVHLHRYYRKYGNDGWYLRCDIKNFFGNISHEVAKQAVDKRIADAQTKHRIYEIIDSYDTDKGIGLGSQVSQLIALAVLDDLDHFIKEQLHIKYYMRYMDDMILICDNKEYLKYCRSIIKERLNKLGLELNQKKTKIIPLKQGIKLLQWNFKLSNNGKIHLYMNNKKPYKQQRKMVKIYAKEKAGIYPEGVTYYSLTCWLANAKRGDTYYKQIKMKSFYNKLITQGATTC